jgi:hypothetical protein
MSVSSLLRVPVAVLCLAACAGGPQLSEDARLVRRVEGVVVSLARAYEHQDAQALFDGVAPTLPGRESLRAAVEDAFARFDRIELTLSIERVHLEGSTTAVFVHWDGRWRQAAREPLARQGTARFVVTAGNQVQLVDVVGENPFGPVPDGGPRP